MARAWSVCSAAGCPELVPRAGKCPACQEAARQARNATRKRDRGYSSAEWRRTRRAFLAAHPTCECDDCLKLPELERPWAEVVDHRDSLGPRAPRGLDWMNLRAMCKAHHDRRTFLDQVRNVER